MESNFTFDSSFTQWQQVGKGSFGEVFKALTAVLCILKSNGRNSMLFASGEECEHWQMVCYKAVT